MPDATLAVVSDRLVVSAMAVYALAMLAYGAFAAFGRPAAGPPGARAARSGAEEERPPVLAGAGGPTAAGAHVLAPPPPPVPERQERTERLGRVAVSLTLLAFGLHVAAVVSRGLAAGRAPVGNMYEFTLTAALAAVAVFLVVLRRHDVRPAGAFLTPLVLLALGAAYTLWYAEAGELKAQLESVWLVIHVSAAIVSAGAFSVGAALLGWYLWRSRLERRGRPSAGHWTAARIEAVAYRVHAFVFPLWTFAVVSGAIWAENAWGRYWNWDPKETWALITWVLYAAYLHARATAGWRGGRAAAVALAGFVALVFNLVGVNLFFAGLHSYAY